MKKIYLTLSAIATTFLIQAQNPTFQWVNGIGGSTGNDEAKSIAVDGSGNVYTTGQFQGILDFDPSATGTYTLASAGGEDIYISKFDALGNFVWAKIMGGTNNERALSIAIDATGNIYTCGQFKGTADFDPSPTNTYTLTSVSGSADDIFVSKLDALGNFVWAVSMGGTSNERALSMAVEANGNVYTTGPFQGTVDFNPSPSVTSTLTSFGGADIFVSKLDAGGNFIWAKKLGGTGFDEGSAIALDVNGNVYCSGYFQGTADFDPNATTYTLTSFGNTDAFVSKLDAAGNFVWAQQLGGLMGDKASGIAVDATGNVYTTGSFLGTADFNPSLIASYTLTPLGAQDIFVSKLDPSGSFVWVQQIGGNTYDISYAITVDASGNSYTTGYFYGTADFDPNPVNSYTLTSIGAGDIFISKLDPSGNFVWAQQMGGIDTEQGNSIITDANGNIYIGGSFYQTVDFDPSATGSYTLTSQGWYDAFTLKLTQGTATNIQSTHENNALLYAYPNPNNGLFTVELKHPTTLTLFNLLGTIVYHQKFTSGNHSIDLENQANGLYFLKSETNGQVQTLKILKK